MNASELEHLLSQKEGLTLEFKKEMYKIDDTRQDTKSRQRDELIKDILSLANGNAGSAGKTAHLIIGADDHLDEDGNREVYDVADQALKPQRLLQLVNAACKPPLTDIWCDSVDWRGKRLIVITIPPSPHLHETTRDLNPGSSGDKKEPSHYSEHVVLIRQNEHTAVASAEDRTALQRLKRIRFEETRRVDPIKYGMAAGALLGGSLMVSRQDEVPGRRLGYGIGGMIAGALTLGLLGRMYKDYVEINLDWPDMPLVLRIGIYLTPVISAFGLGPPVNRLLHMLSRQLRKHYKYRGS